MSLFREKAAALIRHPTVSAVLCAAPGPVFAVGGSVRDLLLDRKIHDLDLVVPGSLADTARRAARRLGVKAVPMGRPPLTIFRLPFQDLNLDLCPLEGRDLEEDLRRRDLTVNALALPLKAEPREDDIIDPTGGLQDLSGRTARFVSEDNVLADPLRLLRLFRFAADLDLNIDPGSLTLVRRHAALIDRPAGERIREELLKLLMTPRCHRLVTLMLDSGLLTALLPELEPLGRCEGGDYHHLGVLDHTLLALAKIEDFIDRPEAVLKEHAGRARAYLLTDQQPALLKLAVLLHDLGKPSSKTIEPKGRIRFLKHQYESEKQTRTIAARWRLSSRETQVICSIVRHHMSIFHLVDAYGSGCLTHKGLYRFHRRIGRELYGLVLHTLADAAAAQGPAQIKKGGFVAVVNFIHYLLTQLEDQKKNLNQGPPLLTGLDLLTNFNLTPSPLIGRILAAVQEDQAVGRIKTRQEALNLVAEILAEETF